MLFFLQAFNYTYISNPNLADVLFSEGVTVLPVHWGLSPYPTLMFFALFLGILLGACSVLTELRVHLPEQLHLGMYVLNSGFKLAEASSEMVLY